MPQTVLQKLRIKPGMTLLSISAPKTFAAVLGELPEGVTIKSRAKDYQQVHWFVANKQQMEAEVEGVISLLKPGVICWIYYPKGSSGMQTDLTRDKGWENLLKHDELSWISLISFDETWSTFGMRLKSQEYKAKEQKPADREIFDWVNPATKEVKLPEDLKAALTRHPEQQQIFNKLAFTHKKEYIEWIVTAKKPETRQRRIAGTIEMLANNKKHP